MAYNGCDGDTGYSSKNTSNTSNSAKARLENTKREVRFIAGAYYDYCKFAFGSGYCANVEAVNNEINKAINKFVTSGKIKRESYNKFIKLFNSVGRKSLNNSREAFIKIIIDLIDTEEYNKLATQNKLTTLYISFIEMLEKNGIKMSQRKVDMAYVTLMKMFAEANVLDDGTTSDLAAKFGFSNILWETPKVIIQPSDGCCGSRDIYGPAMKHIK